MNPYKKGTKLADHPLEQVFKALGVSKETEFVDKFFGPAEIEAVLEACGLSVDSPIERTLEHKVRIGVSTIKRADLTFQSDDQLYYFEVMSQSGGGRWDDEHHTQIMTKTFRLGLEYGSDNVHTFAIAFKEFDAEYLSEIQRMENGYAIHLRFNDNGYFADVYGVEEKKRAVRVKLASLEELGNKLIALGKAAGLPFRKNEIQGERYIYVGSGFENKRDGIEWVMYSKNTNQLGIKMHRNLAAKYGITIVNDNIDAAINFLSSAVPSVEFLPSKGPNDNTGTIKFNFDCTDLSEANIKVLVAITKSFAEYTGLSNLIK
jgi:hypothetical protein